ncbi:MAG: SpoIIE family protein phosphatase [Candidatus Kapaibacterium sp.]
MQRLILLSIARLRRLPESQLRILYLVIAIISLAGIVLTTADVMRYGIRNSDDCGWQTRRYGDEYGVFVREVIPGRNADIAGIRTGDRVLAINGEPLPSHDPDVMQAAQDILNRAPSDKPVPYVVERQGQALQLTIILTKQPIFFQFVVPLFAFLWLLIGIIVVLSRPRGLVQRRFFLTAATVTFTFSFPGHLFTTPRDMIAATLWMVVGTLFYPFWILFCSTFPVNQRLFARTLRRIMLLAPLSLILAPTILGLAVNLLHFQMSQGMFDTLGKIGQAAGVLYFVMGVWVLFRGYRRMPASTGRRPVVVILAGTILASLALLYLTVIFNTQTPGLVIFYPQYLLPVLLLLALPISFGYAIFKYQVMDFRRVVKTTLVYMATMALIAGLYLALGYAIGQALGALTGEFFKGTVEVISFVLFLLLFEPVKRQVQTGIENKFFPQRRNYSAHMAAYAAEIAETTGTTAVAQLTARTLRNALNLFSVCVVVENSAGDMDAIARESDFAPIPVDEAAIAKLRRLLRESHSLIALELITDPSLARLQERFSYAVGLYAQGRVIGAILMSRPHDDDALSGSQSPFIAGVAAQGAAALEVARLYEGELARQRYQEELATARRIQESLLPTTMPQFPGISISAISRPAEAVGGDYYDVIRLDDDRFLVIVADVSGKGLPASLYMAEFHGMVHVASAMQKSPGEILTLLNEHLFDIIKRGSFITASMLLFDTARKSVSFARAGHTPIIRRNSSQVDTLIPAGVALGLCSRDLFAELLQEYTVEYEPGETFILYSDGVSEAVNEVREEFGDGRLHDIIAQASDPGAEALRDRLLENVEKFRGGAVQNDDITLVVIKVEKSITTSIERDQPLKASAR